MAFFALYVNTVDDPVGNALGVCIHKPFNPAGHFGALRHKLPALFLPAKHPGGAVKRIALLFRL